MICGLCGGAHLEADCRRGVVAIREELPFQYGSATSHAAAVSMKARAPNLRDRVLSFIILAGPVTDEEIATGLELNPSTARPRRVELQRAGLIEPAGQKVTISGRRAVAWRAGNNR